MKVLMISFSVNGAMGDNFKMIARNLSKLCEVSVLTNKSVKPEDVGTDRICNVRFDRKMMVDFINPVSYCKITWVRYKQINISLKIRNIAIKVLNL